MTTTQKQWIWLLAGIGISIVVAVAFSTARYLSKIHGQSPPHAQGVAVTTEDDSINAAWLIEGTPRFQITHFLKTPDGKVSAGLWEATGPAKFEWHYGTDETVLVLEGGAKLTYQGRVNEIGPGSSVYFRAGEVVLWEVPERIKKTWVLHEPGRVTRYMRYLME